MYTKVFDRNNEGYIKRPIQRGSSFDTMKQSWIAATVDVHQRNIDHMKSNLPEINMHLEVLRRQKETIDTLNKRGEKIKQMQQILETEMRDAALTIHNTESKLNLLCCHVQPVSSSSITTYGQSWHHRHFMECALCHAGIQVDLRYTGDKEFSDNFGGRKQDKLVFPYNSNAPFISVDDLGPTFSGVVQFE